MCMNAKVFASIVLGAGQAAVASGTMPVLKIYPIAFDLVCFRYVCSCYKFVMFRATSSITIKGADCLDNIHKYVRRVSACLIKGQ